MYSAYVSKYNSKLKAQVIFLMVSNGEGRETVIRGHEAKFEGRRWHYHAVKELSIIKRNNV